MRTDLESTPSPAADRKRAIGTAVASRSRRAPSRRLSLVVLLCAAGAAHGAELPERCRLQPVNGDCKAMMEKFRFDAKAARCTAYFYDGCGPVVPFETMEECRALCEPPPAGDNGAAAPLRELEELSRRAAESAVAPAPPAGAPGKVRPNGLAYDPVEDDPRYAEAFRTIDDEVKAELSGMDVQRRGSVHVYWATKKGILKRKYGIDWRDPGEMNPHVIFD